MNVTTGFFTKCFKYFTRVLRLILFNLWCLLVQFVAWSTGLVFAWLLQILLILSPLLLLVIIPSLIWVTFSAYGSSQGAISSAFEWTGAVVNQNGEAFVNFWMHAASGMVPSRILELINADLRLKQGDELGTHAKTATAGIHNQTNSTTEAKETQNDGNS
jgi:hypothetical protein